MRALVLGTVCAVLGQASWAEMRNEEHLLADSVVRITVVDTIEILAVGHLDRQETQVLSGADIEIVAFAGDADSVALVGTPVLVAEMVGTHSCDAGDARAYWVVTLGDTPTPEGPVTTCEELTASVTSGAVVLEADAMSGEGAYWAWAPGQGWRGRPD